MLHISPRSQNRIIPNMIHDPQDLTDICHIPRRHCSFEHERHELGIGWEAPPWTTVVESRVGRGSAVHKVVRMVARHQVKRPSCAVPVGANPTGLHYEGVSRQAWPKLRTIGASNFLAEHPLEMLQGVVS